MVVHPAFLPNRLVHFSTDPFQHHLSSLTAFIDWSLATEFDIQRSRLRLACRSWKEIVDSECIKYLACQVLGSFSKGASLDTSVYARRIDFTTQSHLRCGGPSGEAVIRDEVTKSNRHRKKVSMISHLKNKMDRGDRYGAEVLANVDHLTLPILLKPLKDLFYNLKTLHVDFTGYLLNLSIPALLLVDISAPFAGLTCLASAATVIAQLFPEPVFLQNLSAFCDVLQGPKTITDIHKWSGKAVADHTEDKTS
jgi:hypothetical protein